MENGSGTKGLQTERGLDTVKLQGEGFELLASPGQDVKTGDPILRLDRDMKIVFSRGSLVKITKVINNNSVVALADNGNPWPWEQFRNSRRVLWNSRSW